MSSKDEATNLDDMMKLRNVLLQNSDFDQDEYGEVLNGEKTYKSIAKTLDEKGSIVIGWTDQAMTHLDILFCVQPIQVGSLQRGMSALTDLFVAISGFGMFGFEINEQKKFPDYVGEKLRLGGDNTTTVALAELINAIIKELM